MRIIEIYPETVSDGYGIRYAIYFAGCSHGCPGCHNPEGQNPDTGDELTDRFFDIICNEINGNPLLDGVTLSGGDPMYRADELLDFLQKLRSRTSCNVWCYTGYTLEECCSDPVRRECLKHIDVLVDGRYVEALRDPRLDFRGSSNQRIIRLDEIRDQL
ncbi:MAG: anaerobic ribonucleoside-triphosphate reductase activating protein [Alistipes sp.]|nr:anaerobic ribonucleoside-triphosphate reductase activating protein [Alistipes sp.]